MLEEGFAQVVILIPSFPAQMWQRQFVNSAPIRMRLTE
jgi:hypothetical protein